MTKQRSTTKEAITTAPAIVAWMQQERMVPEDVKSMFIRFEYVDRKLTGKCFISVYRLDGSGVYGEFASQEIWG